MNGPEHDLSTDLVFYKDKVLTICATHNFHFKPTSARYHSILGVEGSSHETIRFVVQKLLKERAFDSKNILPVHSDYEIMARAAFLRNALLDFKFVSSFKLARDYHPAFSGLHQTPLCKGVRNAHSEKASGLALPRLMRTENGRSLKRTILRYLIAALLCTSSRQVPNEYCGSLK